MPERLICLTKKNMAIGPYKYLHFQCTLMRKLKYSLDGFNISGTYSFPKINYKRKLNINKLTICTNMNINNNI